MSDLSVRVAALLVWSGLVFTMQFAGDMRLIEESPAKASAVFLIRLAIGGPILALLFALGPVMS